MSPWRCRDAGALAICVLVAAPALAAPDPLARAVALHRAGELTAALAAYQEVIDAGSGSPENPALAHHNACYVLIDLADPAQALVHCERALALRRELGDDRGVARTLANQGLALRHLGRYDEAEQAYREALAINERLGDAAAAVRVRSNLGVLAMTAGRYGEAMDHHSAAQSLAERHAAEPWAARQARIARLNRSAVLEKLGAYREALDLLRALEAGGDEDAELAARVQANLGVMYRNLGDPLRAVDYFARAAEGYARLDDVAGLSNAKLNVALALHLNLGRLEAAELAFHEALDLARAGGDRAEVIQDLFYLGNLQLELGRVGEAERSFRDCLDLASAAGSAEGTWSGLHGLGRVAEGRGDLRAALELFRQAMAAVESTRASLEDADRRAGYFGDKRPIYAAAVRVLARLHRDEPAAGHGEEALAVVQRAKARELLDALGAERAPAEPLAAAALRSLLGEGEVALEYFRGEDDLYLWIVRRHGVRFVDLGPARPILDQVARVHDALASGRDPPAEVVAGLSRALLSEAAVPADATVLKIAPDGKLFQLPFEILAAPGAGRETLIDRLSVAYLPSVSTLALLLRRRDAQAQGPRPALRLVGFGNPELPAAAAAPWAPASLLVTRHGLGPLPAAQREIATVGRILAGRQETRVGGGATERAFRDLAARDSLVMHLATHAIAGEGPGRVPAVLLAAGAGHDGVLHPREIAALDYRARLTVLSSCRSAPGETEDGRALTSLAEAFLAAGSSGVVAALWDVEDAAAAAFMTQFYDQLGRGLSAAEALRRAKLRLRAEPGWNWPALWSAYVLVGEGERVVRRPLVPAWAWITAALLLAAGLRLGLRR